MAGLGRSIHLPTKLLKEKKLQKNIKGKRGGFGESERQLVRPCTKNENLFLQSGRMLHCMVRFSRHRRKDKMVIIIIVMITTGNDATQEWAHRWF